MIKQHAFEQACDSQWQAFDRLYDILTQSQSKQVASVKEQYQFPVLYRRICQHYAIAKQRHYSPSLIDQLHQRVLLGHGLLYQNKTAYLWRLLMFVWVSFPLQLRRHWRFFWIAMVLFYLPAVALGLACYFDNEMIYSVMSEGAVAQMEYMYDPSNEMIGRSAQRQSDSDLMMLGYYINNNISIDFQIYAMGILAGLGTVVMLVYNGVIIGAVSGHLTQLGFSETFWSFVCGHGSFELMAAVIAGMAGLRLAQPLYAPGQYKRMDAFKLAGRESIQLLLGAAFMTFIAAFIEAFWSSSSVIPNGVKYTVAAVLWTLVIAYLLFAGRGYALVEANLIDDELEQHPPEPTENDRN